MWRGRSSLATSALFTRTPRTAAGKLVARLPSTGIGRRARAFLLRLRTGCSWTAQLLFKQRGRSSPSCVQCPADETIQHILCQRPGYADIRRLSATPTGHSDCHT
ncbi:hypothetical protein MRX96_031651 [Rhipicephalus microplus]